MRHIPRVLWTAGVLCLSLTVHAVRAQTEGTATPEPDSASAEPKKKGGLFGKVKGLAGNKVVQDVAKTAACTMVPGGQVIAGAIDAASSKDAGAAAAGAASAATGQPCMPGGLAGAAAGAAGMPGGGVPGEMGAAGLAGTVAGMPGLPSPGAYPGGAMPSGAMEDGGLSMGSPDEIAGCMGITVEEYLDFTDPTRGQARPATKEEMKRQSALAKKIDMRRYQACMMQQASSRMAMAGQMPAPRAATSDDEPAAGGNLSEAPGKSVSLSAKLAADLTKGKTVVKDIDWLAGGGDVTESGKAAFTDAMARLASAIKETGGKYQADIYLDKRYEDVAVSALGPARLTVVLAALQHAGLDAGVVTAGKVKKDKNPRLELVKAKN